MLSLLTAFFVSFVVTAVIIRTQKLHTKFSGDIDLDGPQKFHKEVVPRVGGLAIGLGVFISIALHYQNSAASIEELLLFVSALPTFLIGISEDITKKISVRTRLLVTAVGALIAVLALGAQINNVGISLLDPIMAIPMISVVFAVFAITGLANSYNIIDGFNGLSSMVGMITLVALGYMGIQFSDSLIIFLSFIMVAAIMGFFLFNYPRGLIFLGDGGAYLIGFWVATLSVILVNRHSEISPWFAVVVNAYPIMETLFTIYRRKFHQGKSPGHPDGIHFHSLIFRRVLNASPIRNEYEWFSANARTSPYLWILTTLAIVPSILFWFSTTILMVTMAIFISSYIWIYKRMVTFRAPTWMHL